MPWSSLKTKTVAIGTGLLAVATVVAAFIRDAETITKPIISIYHRFISPTPPPRDDDGQLLALIERGRVRMRGDVKICKTYLHDVATYLKNRGDDHWREVEVASKSNDPNELADSVNAVFPILESMFKHPKA
jgi:hypothetical protein